jgi:hypothetical protein
LVLDAFWFLNYRQNTELSPRKDMLSRIPAAEAC